MSISLVQHTTGHNNTTSLGVAFVSNVTAGNCLICFVVNDKSSQTNTVSDNVNGSWTAAITYLPAGGPSIGIFYFANAAAGATTVTVTAPTSTGTTLMIAEWSGLATSAVLDGSGGTGTTFNGAPNFNIATTVDGDLIFAGGQGGGTGFAAGAGTGYTQIDLVNSNQNIDQYQIQTTHNATTAVNFASPSGSSYTCGIAFLAAGGGSTPITKSASDTETLSDADTVTLGLLNSNGDNNSLSDSSTGGWGFLSNDSNVPTDTQLLSAGFGPNDAEVFSDQGGFGPGYANTDGVTFSDLAAFALIVPGKATPYRHLHSGLNRGVN